MSKAKKSKPKPDEFIVATRARYVRQYRAGKFKTLQDFVDDILQSGLSIGAGRERDHSLTVIAGLQSSCFFDESAAILKAAYNGIIDVPISETSTKSRMP